MIADHYPEIEIRKSDFPKVKNPNANFPNAIPLEISEILILYSGPNNSAPHGFQMFPNWK